MPQVVITITDEQYETYQAAYQKWEEENRKVDLIDTFVPSAENMEGVERALAAGEELERLASTMWSALCHMTVLHPTPPPFIVEPLVEEADTRPLPPLVGGAA